MRSPDNIISKLKFYREIAEGGLEYTPPTQFFKDTEEVITALIKEVNGLRAELRQIQQVNNDNEEKSQDGTT